MIKLTQKQYIAKLNGTYFIACCHNVTIQEILDSIADQSTKELPAIYRVDRAQLRSKDIVMHYSNHRDGTKSGKSYRGFQGTNKYYSEDDLLIHRNTQGSDVAIFLNM